MLAVIDVYSIYYTAYYELKLASYGVYFIIYIVFYLYVTIL